MKKKIITVSRQFGSGGRTIAKALAEKLGYAYYDSALVDKVAKETGFDPGYIEDAGEYAPGKSILSYAFSSAAPHASGKLIATDYLWSAQCKIILELAEKGMNTPYEEVLRDIITRDKNDREREVAPAVAADDAILLDNSELDLDGTVDAALAIIRSCIKEA